MTLVNLWALLVALAVILYVTLDGISLGVALLFPTAADEEQRNTLMNTIAPVWDANQTWLVFGGAAVFVAFPVVYTVFSSALYIPLMTFVMGLVFRGVTFEFRAAASQKRGWDRAFFWGSLVAVFSQGLMLGGILTGIPVSQDSFSGSPLGWLTPFSLMVGSAMIPGYMMLAACYLILKTEGPVQDRAFRWARGTALVVFFFMALVTVWTPYHYPLVWENWFSAPRIYFVWAFPLFGLMVFYRLLKDLRRRRDRSPLFWAIGLFLSGYLGLMTSLYPYAIPPVIKLEAAAAQRETLLFAFWGAVIILPVVIGYVIYSYWVFRGKVGRQAYYGEKEG